MIDKLEIRVPYGAVLPFNAELTDVVRDACTGRVKGWGASDAYVLTGDLRPYGYDARLHLQKRHVQEGQKPDSKIELYDTGSKSWADCVGEVERIMPGTDPLTLETMRVDLTTDLNDVPVSFFLDNARVDYKRFGARIGKARAGENSENFYMDIGQREIETVYHGKRPNCYRIYNKTAERFAEYKRITRNWTPAKLARAEASIQKMKDHGIVSRDLIQWAQLHGWDGRLYQTTALQMSVFEQFCKMIHEWRARVDEDTLPKPTFAEVYGHDESKVVTRVERQIGAQQIKQLDISGGRKGEPAFRTLRDLKTNVVEFNPFSPLRFANAGMCAPNPVNYSLRDYMAGMYMRERIGREGWARTQRFMSLHANGNLERILESLRDFLPPKGGEVVSINEAALYDAYRADTHKQLVA